MQKRIKSFLKTETGAISTDWVILTATVVGLVGSSAALLNSGIESAATHIEDGVIEQKVGL